MFSSDNVTVPLIGYFTYWYQYRHKGILPREGGIEAQELKVWNTIQAIELVVSTWQDKLNKEFDWKNFTVTQRAIIKELESYDD